VYYGSAGQKMASRCCRPGTVNESGLTSRRSVKGHPLTGWLLGGGAHNVGLDVVWR